MPNIGAVVTPLEGDLVKQRVGLVVGGLKITPPGRARENASARGDEMPVMVLGHASEINPRLTVCFLSQNLRKAVDVAPFDG